MSHLGSCLSPAAPRPKRGWQAVPCYSQAPGTVVHSVEPCQLLSGVLDLLDQRHCAMHVECVI